MADVTEGFNDKTARRRWDGNVESTNMSQSGEFGMTLSHQLGAREAIDFVGGIDGGVKNEGREVFNAFDCHISVNMRDRGEVERLNHIISR
jgi:hypothetical protein